MAEDFIGGPADGTGKKVRTRSRTIGGQVVHEQAIFTAAAETYYAVADAVPFAANKHHFTMVNGSLSSKIVKVKKVFAINLQLAAATGVAVRFDFKRATAAVGGTTVVPNKADSLNADKEANLAIVTNATTVTEGALLWPFVTNNDEAGATNAFPSNIIQQFGNLVPEGGEVQELTLRPGEGFTIKQITTSVVGSFAWFVVFTQE